MLKPRNMISGIVLTGLALVGSACYQDPEVEVVNGCGETIVFAHYDETHWAPEYRDQGLAELEWKKIKAGESIEMVFPGWRGEPTTVTVVAEDAPLVWDPIEADVEWEYIRYDDTGSENTENTAVEPSGYWDPKRIQLVGDLCGS